MDRSVSFLKRVSNFTSYYLAGQEEEGEQIVTDLYPMIIWEAVQDPDPWKSLKATGQLARVNKCFLKIVREIIRPGIVMRLVPGLSEVRLKWLEPKPKVFRMQISECLVMLRDWRGSARRVYTQRATRIGICSSQEGAGIHDNLWALLSSSTGLFAGSLAFGLAEEQRLTCREYSNTGSVLARVFAFMFLGAVGGYAMWRTGAFFSRGESLELSLGFLQPAEVEVKYDHYPQKGFDPLKKSLRELMHLDKHALLRSCAFKSRRDVAVWLLLDCCVDEALSRVASEKITKGEGDLAINACSEIWSNYCS